MTPTRLTLATRRSALALAQARAFARDLVAHWPGLAIEELHVVTTGDKVTTVPLAEIGGKGLFTKEIEEALDRGDAHFAVHSFKDVPAEVSPKFAIACVPRRADPRDVLVTRSGAGLQALSAGARIGTSSLRRAMQLALARPDLAVVPLRGNVDTRLRKLDTGELDAIVLASAGLARLGLSARATEALDPTLVVPAPGQGALAIECRAGDEATRAALAPLSDPDTEIAVACERGVMQAVGGSCTLPFGAYAFREGGSLRLHAILAGPPGAPPRRVARTMAWPLSPAQARETGKEAGNALVTA
ncbi:MAG TPA: hydroxymethylbilane synthase [Polyangiaceae bacterium]|nr:hydroxymethylbilane synthase [Polyangiaceae bacterium]